MKFWETFKEEQKKDSNHPWWVWIIFVVGFAIGWGTVAFFAAVIFLFLGWVFSFLWNFSVAPIFSVVELGSIQAAALLFLIFSCVRLIKFFIKS